MLLPIPYDIRLFPFQNLNNDSGKSSDKKQIKLIIKTIKCMSIFYLVFFWIIIIKNYVSWWIIQKKRKKAKHFIRHLAHNSSVTILLILICCFLFLISDEIESRLKFIAYSLYNRICWVEKKSIFSLQFCLPYFCVDMHYYWNSMKFFFKILIVGRIRT